VAHTPDNATPSGFPSAPIGGIIRLPSLTSTANKMKRARPQDWSEAELKRLKGMARRKVNARQIALALGRHAGSVKKKLREIGKVPRKR
jgi:hypothetical protein